MTIEIYPDHSVIFDYMYWGRIDKISATETPQFSRWKGGGGLVACVVMGGEWGGGTYSDQRTQPHAGRGDQPGF